MTFSSDPGDEGYTERLRKFHGLSAGERLALAEAILRRGEDERGSRGVEILRSRYPAASLDMIRTCAYHAYRELPGALRDLLAWAELCLREREHDVHSGLMFDALYHLYNWLQVEALVPYGRQEVFDELKEACECLEKDDKEGALGTLKALMERFEGHISPPDVET